jgi:hypothetical protein
MIADIHLLQVLVLGKNPTLSAILKQVDMTDHLFFCFGNGGASGVREARL